MYYPENTSTAAHQDFPSYQLSEPTYNGNLYSQPDNLYYPSQQMPYNYDSQNNSVSYLPANNVSVPHFSTQSTYTTYHLDGDSADYTSNTTANLNHQSSSYTEAPKPPHKSTSSNSSVQQISTVIGRRNTKYLNNKGSEAVKSTPTYTSKESFYPVSRLEKSTYDEESSIHHIQANKFLYKNKSEKSSDYSPHSRRYRDVSPRRRHSPNFSGESLHRSIPNSRGRSKSPRYKREGSPNRMRGQSPGYLHGRKESSRYADKMHRRTSPKYLCDKYGKNLNENRDNIDRTRHSPSSWIRTEEKRSRQMKERPHRDKYLSPMRERSIERRYRRQISTRDASPKKYVSRERKLKNDDGYAMSSLRENGVLEKKLKTYSTSLTDRPTTIKRHSKKKEGSDRKCKSINKEKDVSKRKSKSVKSKKDASNKKCKSVNKIYDDHSKDTELKKSLGKSSLILSEEFDMCEENDESKLAPTNEDLNQLLSTSYTKHKQGKENDAESKENEVMEQPKKICSNENSNIKNDDGKHASNYNETDSTNYEAVTSNNQEIMEPFEDNSSASNEIVVFNTEKVPVAVEKTKLPPDELYLASVKNDSRNEKSENIGDNKFSNLQDNGIEESTLNAENLLEDEKIESVEILKNVSAIDLKEFCRGIDFSEISEALLAVKANVNDKPSQDVATEYTSPGQYKKSVFESEQQNPKAVSKISNPSDESCFKVPAPVYNGDNSSSYDSDASPTCNDRSLDNISKTCKRKYLSKEAFSDDESLGAEEELSKAIKKAKPNESKEPKNKNSEIEKFKNVSHESERMKHKKKTQDNKNKEISENSSTDETEECSNQDGDHDKMDKKVKMNEYLWVISSPASLYYTSDKITGNMKATERVKKLCKVFEKDLIKRGVDIREESLRKRKETEKNEKNNCDVISSSDERGCRCSATASMKKSKLKKKRGNQANHTYSSSSSSSSSSSNSSSSSSSDSNENEEDGEMPLASRELIKRKFHPDRLHEELWYNEPGQINDGPLCRCSLKAKRSGIRHGFYFGETHVEKCDPWSNNNNILYHYLITMAPYTNFLVKDPTVISYDGHEFIFEGFTLLSHYPLKEAPPCKVIRFNIEYTLLYIEEKKIDNFCIKELDLCYDYLFKEILELFDFEMKSVNDDHGCPNFHFMPRFVRELPDSGKEILSMNEVLRYFLNSNKMLVEPNKLPHLLRIPQYEWQNYADKIKGMIVTSPGKKPCSIRVDQLDRDQDNPKSSNYPVIVHFGIRPPQLSYAGNPAYQKAWREYVKFRHLLANMPKPSPIEKEKLNKKEANLQEMRITSKMKRDVTIAVSSNGFYKTGIMCDMVQHALLLPVLTGHLRFHRSLDFLQEKINYRFSQKYLLQLALTHPSYRENFGTNPDHARNSLTNCGIRQPTYGDRKIHYQNTRKRGINTLINIMSRFGKENETESKITHNERLEFLGDAVVEFLSSIHLFHLFPYLEEGGLATFRAAIVQNQHLAVLAEKLELEKFMLYAHGSDLCHDFELRHAMANCFEALMGAIFLDSDIQHADAVFSRTLFLNESNLHSIWANYPPHPLQSEEPDGDRKWITTFPLLEKLTKLEDIIGVTFKHIRILARAFTDRSVGFNNLTLGSNQRLEFLGDTVLQLVASEYLYRFFPEHHEGHLSLLRSSLVNNRTQALVCDDLGMTTYSRSSHLKGDLKTKDRADLLEAFLGALYIDRGLDFCETFCNVCFFPRLHKFIISQDWNDPKSKLQQCCLTLRTMHGGEPDIPMYKNLKESYILHLGKDTAQRSSDCTADSDFTERVIQCIGPTNTRIYTVAVYFRKKRLAKALGTSIQQAEMNAASKALEKSEKLFPQLDHQRRVISKSVKLNENKLESENARNYVSKTFASFALEKKRRSNNGFDNKKPKCPSPLNRKSDKNKLEMSLPPSSRKKTRHEEVRSQSFSSRSDRPSFRDERLPSRYRIGMSCRSVERDFSPHRRSVSSERPREDRRRIKEGYYPKRHL